MGNYHNIDLKHYNNSLDTVNLLEDDETIDKQPSVEDSVLGQMASVDILSQLPNDKARIIALSLLLGYNNRDISRMIHTSYWHVSEILRTVRIYLVEKRIYTPRT